MPPVLRTLNEIQSADAPFVGGKALNCARLKQAGFPVPDGVVLCTEAMGRSLDIPALHEWLASLPDGVLLAVRSSATDEDSAGHSFAGIHETTLNVAPAGVPDAVRSCWSSVTSPQAVAYRLAQHLSTENPKTAVLVQRMVRPVAAGVAFTVNPVTQSPDEMVINSVLGLGDALVSGLVDPDEFRVRKADGQVLSTTTVNNPPSLSPAQLHELARLLLNIERYYASAQDVEWCHDGAAFWIVQSRPVTGGASQRKDGTWTRANAREVLPDLPSPMTVYSVADTVEESMRRFYGKLLASESELGRMVAVFCGRLFFNVDQFRYICKIIGVAPAVILRSLGHEGPLTAEDEVVQRADRREILAALPDLARIAISQIRVAGRVRKQAERTTRYLAELNLKDFNESSDKQLWEANRQWWGPRMTEEMQLVFMLGAVSAYETPLRRICAQVGMSYERLAFPHLAAGEKSVSGAQAFDLLRLARVARSEKETRSYFAARNTSFHDHREALEGTEFLKSFDVFMESYGHRGRYESDVALPRYREDPSPLLFAIQSHTESPETIDGDAIIERQNREAVEAWKEFTSKVNWWQRPRLTRRARRLLRRIKQFYLWRERCRSDLVRIAWPIRRLHLELARRFVDRGWIDSRDDYFFLTLPEVDAAVDDPGTGSSLASLIARRKSEWEQLAGIDMPLLMKESELPAIIRGTVAVPSGNGGSDLRGLCVSPGYVEGDVVVIHDPGDFARMKRGAILVTTATDPSWTPLFTLASGVIVEVGGLLSHASTVAREYGLPALANLKGATKRLRDGDRVRLDATNGIVTILRSSNRAPDRLCE